MSKSGSKIVMVIDWVLLIITTILLTWMIVNMAKGFDAIVEETVKKTGAKEGVVRQATELFMIGFGVGAIIGLCIQLAFNILLTVGINQKSSHYLRVWVIGNIIFLILQVLAIIGNSIGNPHALIGFVGALYRVIAIYLVQRYCASITSGGATGRLGPEPGQNYRKSADEI